MKCRKCGDAAVIELRRHNAAFCAPDFQEFFRNQVREAIRKHKMFTKDEPVLVAVSGGKDSLALWDVLIDEGYRTTGSTSTWAFSTTRWPRAASARPSRRGAACRC
jgi:hypothetical protein